MKINVGATVLGQQPSKAIAMGGNLAPHHGELLGHDVTPPAIHHKLPVPAHGPQAPAEGLEGSRALEREGGGNGFLRERATGLPQRF